MQPPHRAGHAELAASGEQEYGGGTELPTTGFLVFGLLTFWIYTVWCYHAILRRHFAARLAHFRQALDPSSLWPDLRGQYELLVRKGFTCPSSPRNVSLALYAASLALLLSELVAELLVARGSIAMSAFVSWVGLSIGAAALAFCGASIQFLSWVARSTRDHEYHELLLARLVRDPASFRMVGPSAKFARRWTRNQGLVALFLVLAVHLTLSPVVAVAQLAGATLLGDVASPAMLGWLLALFACGFAFHFFGTQLLLGMHNGHLRVEDVNRELLKREAHWVPEHTAAVLDDAPDGARPGPGQLLPRRVLATIMITDMVGFSRDMELDEAGTYEKLLRHNGIVRDCLASHGGSEIKTMGDAFLVSFATPLDAVQAAVAIQGGLSLFNQSRRDPERIVVRIGIHTGEVLTLDRDVLGNAVNLAARIEPLAEGGGICLSADTYASVGPALGIEVVRLGRKALKNIADPPELFSIPSRSIAAASERG